MRRQSGTSKLEFIVVVAVLGLLATILLVRLNELQGQAERLHVEMAIRNIRSGIQIAIGERIMQGREDRIAEIASANPISFLGAVSSGPALETSGNLQQWSYDPVRRELIYSPRLPDAFHGARELRWHFVARVDAIGRTVGISLVGLN